MSTGKDMIRIVGGLGAREASANGYDTPPRNAARNLIHETIVLHKDAADAMAADATAYTAAPMQRAPRAGRLLGAYFVPEAGATADDTDFATLEATKGDGLGGAGVVMASKTTKITGGTGDLAAGVTKTLALAAALADTKFPKGAVLGFALAKAGAGVVIPPGSFCLDVEWEDTDGYGVL